ncbi:hypothetical protein [Flavobacterium wongokense]|uniref:hypothetical protein n=1 Tax=Flavobacterium wongokense TaxID=2910674 RepID=UPI001F171357|nr:hypothetical protein [Flavobacterium sp. WG47]MCF6132724.1 hypothetical protein [Flavobacterium sp. WG47]
MIDQFQLLITIKKATKKTSFFTERKTLIFIDLRELIAQLLGLRTAFNPQLIIGLKKRVFEIIGFMAKLIDIIFEIHII